MDYDLLLKKHNLKYEDLNPMERETFHQMVEAMRQGQLTMETIRDHISAMKQSVEQELTRFDLGSKQDIFLKARLRNYILLEALLMTPEIAQKRLDQALRNR